MIILSMATFVFALEQTKTQDKNLKGGLIEDVQQLGPQNTKSTNTPDEAMRVANQYQTISNNIKSQGNGTGLNNQSVFSMSIFPQIKFILNEIQSLSQNLIDSIMPGGVPKSPDSAKVDTIINKLDSHQQTLSGFTQTKPNQPTQQPPAFNPDNFDRPKEHRLQIYK